MKVIGMKRVDVDRDGVNIHGYKYFCTDVESDVVGYTVDSFFVSDRVISKLERDIALDDEVIPVYKRESKVLRTVVFA